MKELSELTFWVNREEYIVPSAGSPLPLVQYLRSTGLTGTKLSCGEGSCGSCTVLLSRISGSGELLEVTVTSCSLQLDLGLHGAHVTTVEGLGSTRTCLHPIQERQSLMNPRNLCIYLLIPISGEASQGSRVSVRLLFPRDGGVHGRGPQAVSRSRH